MKQIDWQPNARVYITSGTFSQSSSKLLRAKWNGRTTDKPPYRDGSITKVEVLDDTGCLKQLMICRVKLITQS